MNINKYSTAQITSTLKNDNQHANNFPIFKTQYQNASKNPPFKLSTRMGADITWRKEIC